ncbi:hypothetical protein CSA37_08700 [Candidatus Fermentibacteria bacterium]|nr:MAG: hypothetical protein CSA37_08700 [Candidatus Fermentibacteria bacterium]
MDRREFKDLEQVERCSLIGTCLSSADVKKLLKKCGYRTKGITGVEAHRMLVKHTADDAALAAKVSSLLESRYDSSGMQWMNIAVPDRIHLWRRSLGSSDVAHMLWAGIVMGDEEFREGLLTDFCAYRQGCVTLAAKRQDDLERSHDETERYQEKYKASRQRERELKRERDDAVSRIRELEHRIKELEQKVSAFRTNSPEQKNDTDELENKLHKAEDNVGRYMEEVDSLKKKLSDSEERMEELSETNAAAMEQINDLLEQLKVREKDCSVCPGRAECSRNVLLVGGITKLKAVYKEIIEKSGADFRYHNGRYVGGEEMLESGISWADVVLCPVDVNSHRAALSVKKICRKMDKPFMMLRSSSISSISRAMDDMAHS